MRVAKAVGAVASLLFLLSGSAWSQMPLYTKGAVAEKVPGHNLVIIYPDKSPSQMDHQRRLERAALQQAVATTRPVVAGGNNNANNTIIINNNTSGAYLPDSFITRVYQVQTPRFWRRQYSYGYTFTGRDGFYRPYYHN